ncbi:hypothetical protein QJQ45_025698, partial [Haematococcus lacustris]
MRAEDAENDAGCNSMTFTLDAAASALAVAELWKAGSLVDCVIMSQVDGHRIPAHRLVLAAASRYFCAVFLGAGAHMKEGGQLVDGATSSQLVLVPMPVPGAELELVMRAIYGLELKVDAGNLEVLLHLASYLGLPLVQEACCTFMRTALSLATAVPLLVLAARYGCLALRAELLTFISTRFTSLAAPPANLVSPSPSPSTPATPQPPTHPKAVTSSNGHGHSSSPGTSSQAPHSGAEPGQLRSPLAALPRDLLLELLQADELAVDCETEVLQAVLDWVASDPAERLADLPDLLAAVRLEQLPADLTSVLPPPGRTPHTQQQAPPTHPHTHTPWPLPSLPSLPAPAGPDSTCCAGASHCSSQGWGDTRCCTNTNVSHSSSSNSGGSSMQHLDWPCAAKAEGPDELVLAAARHLLAGPLQRLLRPPELCRPRSPSCCSTSCPDKL